MTLALSILYPYQITGQIIVNSYLTWGLSKNMSMNISRNFVSALHHGFNQTINKALFINNKEQLFEKNNSFKHIESEINDFFKLSKAINFEEKTNFKRDEAFEWLVIFSLHCRMCERGLIVDSSDIKKLGFK